MDEFYLARFDYELNELESYYRGRFFVTPAEVRSQLEGLCLLVDADPDGKMQYLERFQRIVDHLKSTKSSTMASKDLHVLGFCMRHLKWGEIGEALKSIFPDVICPDRRLKIEVIIRGVYDPEWKDGCFALKAPILSEWDDLA